MTERLPSESRAEQARYDNQALIRRIERAPDFGYDDEEVELNRRLGAQALSWQWEGDRIEIYAPVRSLAVDRLLERLEEFVPEGRRVEVEAAVIRLVAAERLEELERIQGAEEPDVFTILDRKGYDAPASIEQRMEELKYTLPGEQR